jgi:hypothetical protein
MSVFTDPEFAYLTCERRARVVTVAKDRTSRAVPVGWTYDGAGGRSATSCTTDQQP